MATRTQVLIPISIAAVIIGVAGIVSIPSEVKLQQVEFPVGTIKIDGIILSVKIADTEANMARGLMFEEKKCAMLSSHHAPIFSLMITAR